MSHLVYIKFGTDLRLCQVYDELKTRGIEISVRANEDGVLFYVPNKSFRGIYWIVEKDGKYDGYLKRNVGANRTDLVMFANLLDAFRVTHNARLFDEDDEYEEIENPLDKFSEDWIDTTLGHDFSFLKTISAKDTVVLFGVNRAVSVGPWLFEQAGVSEDRTDVENADLAYDRMTKLQWLPGNDVPTSSRLRIEMNNELMSVSAYMYSTESQGANYDYTLNAKVFCIFDIDKKDVVWFDYAHLPEVVPASWERMDQTQYHIKPLTREEFDRMFERARKFQLSSVQEGKVIREANDNNLDSPLINYLYDKEEGKEPQNYKISDITVTKSNDVETPPEPKQSKSWNGEIALIIVCVIGAIYISTKGFRVSLIAFILCVIVIVCFIISARKKKSR